jgi:hypothetical protein
VTAEAELADSSADAVSSRPIALKASMKELPKSGVFAAFTRGELRGSSIIY